MNVLLKLASQRLDRWIDGERFIGWDPFDALNSPILNGLTFGNQRIGQVWVQLLRRSPLNLRPLFGVRKGYNPKGMGLFLASYWRKYQMTGNSEHLERVKFFFEWLRSNVSSGYHGPCWGYNFPWPNRGFFAPAGTPTIVNTVYICMAMLDLFDQASPFGDIPLSLARGACEFILCDLNSDGSNSDELAFSYTPLDERYVHNASILGASLLAEVGTRTGEDLLCAAALKAARFTARRQRSDGAWVYGVAPYDNWVDNFHTGFVLVALNRISELLATKEFRSAIQKGYNYWKESFFLSDGTPKYYDNAIFPVDSHCVAQAILTHLAFVEFDPDAFASAIRMALWGIDHLQNEEGYFYYQTHPTYTIRIPYMRWTQAWMQRALTELEFQSV